jgi:hypothetical protein
MTAYNEITDAQTETGDLLDQTLIRRLRDNPIAIAEGDATVPVDHMIKPKAFVNSILGEWVSFEHLTDATTGASYTKVFGVKASRAGEVRAKLIASAAATALGNHTIYARVYVNGVAEGTEAIGTVFSGQGSAGAQVSDDISVEEGDIIEVYTKGSGSFTSATARLLLKVGNPINYAYLDN